MSSCEGSPQSGDSASGGRTRSTLDEVASLVSSEASPPKNALLQDGEKLSVGDFTSLVSRGAFPEGVKKAELIDNLVWLTPMAGPLHSDGEFVIGFWLGHYTRYNRSARVRPNHLVSLQNKHQVAPDFGVFEIRSEENILKLAVEIADSSIDRDLGMKKTMYQEAGVEEYLVFCVGESPRRICWSHLFDGKYQLIQTQDGYIRSLTYPTLALHIESARKLDHVSLADKLDAYISGLQNR